MKPAAVFAAAVLLAAGDAPRRVPRYPDRSKLLVVRDAEGNERPVKTADDWKLRREQILLGMEEVMGPLAGPEWAKGAAGLPLDVKVEGEEALDRFVRKRISYLSEPESRVPAYLLVPKGLEGKAPAVLCLHQTVRIGKGEPAGAGGKESLHYAADLAERGYVTLAPDYPNFGDHTFDTYGRGYKSGSMKAIRDNRRAVDLLQSLPEVDPERIGCMGHSLGGHNTLFTAAFEPRIKALVSNCGFNAFGRYYGGDLKGWSSKTYMPAIPAYGGWRNMPFDFHEVVGALAPRPFLAIAPLRDANFEVEGVREVIASAREVYRLLGAEENLAAEHPDCEHDFPPEMREKAYGWFERHLKAGKGK
ncbi:MAG: alpha/beta fold hydrolase [Planctomycetes bacterium]|nr:alpha/beta fold hydrolase [Planctomycetota bacterium]